MKKILTLEDAFTEELNRRGTLQPDSEIVSAPDQFPPLVIYQQPDHPRRIEQTRLIASLNGPKEGFLDWIMISPQRRGNGLGSALYESIETAFQHAGVEIVELYIHPNNETAQRFCQKRGYVQTEPNKYAKPLS